MSKGVEKAGTTGIMPLLESPKGVVNAFEIADCQ